MLFTTLYVPDTIPNGAIVVAYVYDVLGVVDTGVKNSFDESVIGVQDGLL